MSLKNKFKNFFSLDDEEYEYEYIETDRRKSLKSMNRKTEPPTSLKRLGSRMS